MFSWFRRKSAAPKPKPAAIPEKPALCKGNPGIGVEAQVAFANGSRTWNESVNLLKLATKVLGHHGHRVTQHDGWLEHGESGLILQPQLVSMQPLDGGGVHTLTTININHRVMCPDGVFEYQHATDDNMEESICSGFDQWTQVDFPVFLDALQDKLGQCMAMEMTFPANDGVPARTRRGVLGPVAHLRQGSAAADGVEGSSDEKDHPFCACCFFTRTYEAFKSLIESDGFYAIRFYGARDNTGEPQADCRVNGEDWEEGARAIREYVGTWPDAGLEFRKQTVILQTIPNRPSPEDAV